MHYRKIIITHTFFIIGLLLPVICPAQQSIVQGESQIIWPGKSWPVSSISEQGFEAKAIDSLHNDILAGRYGLIDHFLLIRNGYVVADHHYENDYKSIAAKYDTTNYQYNYDHPEWHPYYKGTDLHTLQSVTKSVTSIGLGMAIEKGFIEGVDTPAMNFFDSYPMDRTDPRREAMLLEDMLTMRSGISWNEMTSYSDSDNSCIIMESLDEWVPFVLEQPMATEPGSTFDYNSGVSVLLGKLVQISTGVRVDNWIEENLFKPIGIENYYWKKTPTGEVDTEGGLYLSTHDLARIGYLFLQNGIWDGEQIVSSEWVTNSVSPVAELSATSGYGYQWWVPDFDEDGTKVFAGNGYGGQFLLVAPEQDIVVVFNGWNIHGGAELSSWKALQERILPATR